MTKPSLDGIRVIDLSRVLGGPLCTQILSDHGAEIIKIEPPAGDETRGWGPPFHDGGSAYFDGVNRNKEGIALNLREQAGQEILFRLLGNADVLVENFKIGTLKKWGIGYDEVLKKKFPKLIHCCVTGFGSTGPYAGFPGYDAVAQSMSGLLSINGEVGRPPVRVGVPIVDITTGMNAATAVLLALFEREKSGLGQSLEVSLYDTAISLLHPHAANWFLSGNKPERMGSAHPSITPYDLFQTKTCLVFLGIGNNRQFASFCKALGREEIASDPRFLSNADRTQHREELRAILEKMLQQTDGKSLCQNLLSKGIPAGPVEQIPDVMMHPHTAAREMVIKSGKYQGTGIPIKLSRTPGAFRRPPPKYGEHNQSVLEKAGYSPEEIDNFLKMQIVLDKPRK